MIIYGHGPTSRLRTSASKSTSRKNCNRRVADACHKVVIFGAGEGRGKSRIYRAYKVARPSAPRSKKSKRSETYSRYIQKRPSSVAKKRSNCIQRTAMSRRRNETAGGLFRALERLDSSLDSPNSRPQNQTIVADHVLWYTARSRKMYSKAKGKPAFLPNSSAGRCLASRSSLLLS